MRAGRRRLFALLLLLRPGRALPHRSWGSLWARLAALTLLLFHLGRSLTLLRFYLGRGLTALALLTLRRSLAALTFLLFEALLSALIRSAGRITVL